MTAASNYLENALLDHVLKNTAYTQPTNLYVALLTTDPTDADTGTEVSATVDDTAYARQTVAFAAASGGTAASSGAVVFPAVVYGTGAAPYNVTHVAIYDAVTAGNLLFHSPLPVTAVRNSGETMTFAAGAITVTLG